ncbi:MAG: GntR family transcriptional regulator [Acidobacteriia bacterium]|nr:GntR family transcriptional regulator [Terriglobia bacterium]
MILDLDPESPVPLYQQIVDQVRGLVAIGALKVGDQLPTVRELAIRGRVNRNTAARAIQQLEHEGVVRTRVGQGTFVADGAGRVDRAGRELTVDAALDRLLVEAHLAGMPLEELGWRLSRRIEGFRRRREGAAVGPDKGPSGKESE